MGIKDYLMTEVGPVDKKFEKLVKEIAKATDNNEHTISLLLLAEYLGNKNYVEILKGIDMIHMAYGNMTTELGKLRDKVAKELYDIAYTKLGSVKYDKVMSSY
jgi:hypothetical protein